VRDGPEARHDAEACIQASKSCRAVIYRPEEIKMNGNAANAFVYDEILCERFIFAIDEF
jgi:hypothetical protein